MKQKLPLSTVILLLFLISNSFSQEATKDFNIPLPDQKGIKSLYNKIEFIDSRKTPYSMGFVQVGAFNKKARVVTLLPLKTQLERVASYVTDSTLQEESTLTFQLRKLNFAELTTRNEQGFFTLRANLYIRKGNLYQTILTIDTSIVIQASDVTKILLKNGGLIITNFLVKGLIKKPTDSFVLSFNDVLNIDSLEKSNIKAYTTQNYVDGIYFNYKSFSKQTPDLPIIVDSSDSKRITIKTPDKSGKPIKVEMQKMYAIVSKGQPLIVNKSEYCKLSKKLDDFCFTGRASISADIGEMFLYGFLFGSGGIAYAASSNQAMFEMKLDHKDGSFIKIKELK